jgi:hypothetical protein
MKIRLFKTIDQRTCFCYLLLLITIKIMSCAEDPTEEGLPQDQHDDGSWTIYSPYKWSHDGNPVHSDWCVVYSDGVDESVKIKAGMFFDSKFEEILTEFDFDNENDFLLPPENEKINLYLNRHNEEAFAAAFWGTVFITIREDDIDTVHYSYLFRHELTHEFEYLIEGAPELGTDVWFREGIAIYIGSDGGWNHIRTVDDLNAWISANGSYPDKGNPVCIHNWEDFPEG